MSGIMSTERASTASTASPMVNTWIGGADMAQSTGRVQMGESFGRLTVIDLTPGRRRVGQRYVYAKAAVRCECGTTKSIRQANLLNGSTNSCGCLKNELITELGHRGWRHGHRPTSTDQSPEYTSWRAMKDRVTNPNATGWDRYGGRGITICAEWLNDFSAFLRDMGPRPPETSLDRIDNNGNYEPGNCRWADRRTQMANRRRKTHCAKGHEYTPENTDRWRGSQRCLSCVSDANATRRARYAATRPAKDEDE